MDILIIDDISLAWELHIDKQSTLKHVSMGVFQIARQITDEDYESDGSFNTSSKIKQRL